MPPHHPTQDNDFEEQIKDIIAATLDIDTGEIKNSTTFADLTPDSINFVEVIMALESKFDMDIHDDDAERISSVQDIINYIALEHQGFDFERI